MPRFSLLAAVAGLVLLAALDVARADLILQHESIAINGGGIASDLLAFEPFDPSLGELNEAVFSATISLMFTAQTVAVLEPHPSGNATPVPTVLAGTARVEIDGLLWPFEFAADCVMNRVVISGQNALFPVLVDMTWRSDGLSDQVGFTIGDIGDGTAGPCLPHLFNTVHRSDYLATPITSAAGLLTDFRTIWSVSSSAAPVVGLAAGGGLATLQYDYTPHASEPVPVPEPATGLLLGLALACLGMNRRKRR